MLLSKNKQILYVIQNVALFRLGLGTTTFCFLLLLDVIRSKFVPHHCASPPGLHQNNTRVYQIFPLNDFSLFLLLVVKQIDVTLITFNLKQNRLFFALNLNKLADFASKSQYLLFQSFYTFNVTADFISESLHLRRVQAHLSVVTLHPFFSTFVV